MAGLVLAPGFIDIHNHSTERLFDWPLAETQLAQGITTIVVGADGSSPWPVADYLTRIDELRPTVDVATLVGHGTVRRAALGEDFRHTATDAEIADMSARVERGMREGAFGLSSGLEYDPGFYSSTGELIALARAAADHDGFYMTHMRDEEEGLLDAVDEAIRIGREAGLPVQISHIKAGNASVWGRAPDVLERIRRANEDGPRRDGGPVPVRGVAVGARDHRPFADVRQPGLGGEGARGGRGWRAASDRRLLARSGAERASAGRDRAAQGDERRRGLHVDHGERRLRAHWTYDARRRMWTRSWRRSG